MTTLDSSQFCFREATTSDLTSIVALLADDPLGATRETPDESALTRYRSAFTAIDGDPNHQLLVVEVSGEVGAVLQLSFLPHLTYSGGWRAQVEGVRVSQALRSQGIGRALLEEAIARAKERGCHLIQLTTDRRRPEALRFYEALGFQSTHEGMKLHLEKHE